MVQRPDQRRDKHSWNRLHHQPPQRPTLALRVTKNSFRSERTTLLMESTVKLSVCTKAKKKGVQHKIIKQYHIGESAVVLNIITGVMINSVSQLTHAYERRISHSPPVVQPWRLLSQQIHTSSFWIVLFLCKHIYLFVCFGLALVANHVSVRSDSDANTSKLHNSPSRWMIGQHSMHSD